MYQSGYKKTGNFPFNYSFVAGICKFWFIEKDKVTGLPPIDPQTQYLNGEPALVDGASWYGPVLVPDSQLGFDEQLNVSSAGIYYKQSVSGFYPGDSGTGRINLENMPYYQFLIVGKMRASGLYLLIGDNDNGADFSQEYMSGVGADDTPGTKFSFINNSIKKALILDSFEGADVTPVIPGSVVTPPVIGGNDEEIIFFTDVAEVVIAWNSDRAARFGQMPLIEVWSTDDVQPTLENVPVYCDAPPPAMTQLTVNLTGPSSGFVVIK